MCLCVCMCACHGTHVGPRDWTQFIWFGSKHLYLRSHHIAQSLGFRLLGKKPVTNYPARSAIKFSYFNSQRFRAVVLTVRGTCPDWPFSVLSPFLWQLQKMLFPVSPYMLVSFLASRPSLPSQHSTKTLYLFSGFFFQNWFSQPRCLFI